MPTLYDRIFGEPAKLAERKSKFAEMIERGLRVGRGEIFEEPYQTYNVLTNEMVGGTPEPILFDQPSELLPHQQILSEGFKEFYKRLTGKTNRAFEGFKSNIGHGGIQPPQEKVAPDFGENLDRGLFEEVMGLAGEYFPELIGGGVPQIGFIPGSLAGAAEEIITGGSPSEIAFSSLGGGGAGFLTKVMGRLGGKAVTNILDLRQELTAIEKAVDTGIDHVVTRPDFDLFPEVPISEFDRVLGETLRKTAREGIPEIGPSFTKQVPDLAQQSLPGVGDIVPPKLFEDFTFTVPAPKTRSGASFTEILGNYITRQADETGASVDDVLEKFNSTPIFKATPQTDAAVIRGDIRLPNSVNELIEWRNHHILENAEQFRRGIAETDPLKQTKIPFPKKDPVLRKADAIFSSHLVNLDPMKAFFKLHDIKRPKDFVASFIKQIPDVGRMKIASEIERAQMDPSVSEALSIAKKVVAKTMQGTKKEKTAILDKMDPSKVLALAKQADSSVGKSAQKVTAAVCEAISKGKK